MVRREFTETMYDSCVYRSSQAWPSGTCPHLQPLSFPPRSDFFPTTPGATTPEPACGQQPPSPANSRPLLSQGLRCTHTMLIRSWMSGNRNKLWKLSKWNHTVSIIQFGCCPVWLNRRKNFLVVRAVSLKVKLLPYEFPVWRWSFHRSWAALFWEIVRKQKGLGGPSCPEMGRFQIPGSHTECASEPLSPPSCTNAFKVPDSFIWKGPWKEKSPS
jgi:hypothetical protein